MINIYEVTETNKMVEKENLDVRTITLGINLLDCASENLEEVNEKIYKKITTLAKDLVKTGEEISREIGIPIVNKRISITPISLVGASCCKTPDDYVTIAKTLDKAAHEVGVNFIGGYSAVVSKGMTKSDELLIRSIPKALASTELICSSVNVGSTKTGINMDAVRLMGEIVKETAALTKDADSLGCAKLVVLCNAPDDNPFMAGAFHGVTEDDAIINVGVSGPGVVKYALESVRGESFQVLCETIKKTAFKITRVGQLVAQEASKRLGIPFGIIDLSLAPTPAIGDSVAEILEAVKDGFKAPKKPSAHSTAEFFKVNDRKLDALIKSTTDDLKRAETAVLRMSNDKYRKAIFNAQVAMNTGAVTYEKAVDMACKDMLNAGLNCVEYKNGARHTLSDLSLIHISEPTRRS